jgi:hypothetical protein
MLVALAMRVMQTHAAQCVQQKQGGRIGGLTLLCRVDEGAGYAKRAITELEAPRDSAGAGLASASARGADQPFSLFNK